MRIALCVSGQPRSWERCYENWMEHLLPDIEKDIFFHFWDYNTLPAMANQFVVDKLKDERITDEEKQKIIQTLNPKKYKFDNKNLNYSDDKDPRIITEWVSKPIGWWCRSQFYSLYQAANLKRQYEIENRFEYDIVFRMRSDLYFEKNVNVPDIIEPNGVYSKSNGYMNNVETFMIGDTFYFSDSYTYDQLSEFIYGLDFIDKNHVVPAHVKCPPPETALYPYMCASGIKNISCPQHMKILRTKEYIDLKGSIEKYETL